MSRQTPKPAANSAPAPAPVLRLDYSAAQAAMFFDDAAHGRFRFYPKGRRLGATRGAAHACIEWCLDGMAVLWGDTTHANIGRYVRRYFLPVLKRNGVPFRWNSQNGELQVGDQGGFVDFRSADRPENWEGFGYHRIFLNEAGIILDDRYLYDNAVLPMLMDFPESQLIAAGTPKLRQGKGRLFAELCARAARGVAGFFTRTFTSYDNPFLRRSAVDALARELPEAERQQEIFGKFVESEGTRVKRSWFRTGWPFPKWRRDQCTIALGVDLGGLKQKASNDYTALVVLARDPEGYNWVLHAERDRRAFHAILVWIEQVANDFDVDVVAIEDVQFQVATVQELVRTTDLPVRPVNPGSADKGTRFSRVEVRYEQGFIYHAPTLDPDFVDELLAFPLGDHDDFVDALGYAFLAAVAVQVGETSGSGDDRVAGAEATIHDEDAMGWGSVSVDTHRGF